MRTADLSLCSEMMMSKTGWFRWNVPTWRNHALIGLSAFRWNVKSNLNFMWFSATQQEILKRVMQNGELENSADNALLSRTEASGFRPQSPWGGSKFPHTTWDISRISLHSLQGKLLPGKWQVHVVPKQRDGHFVWLTRSHGKTRTHTHHANTQTHTNYPPSQKEEMESEIQLHLWSKCLRKGWDHIQIEGNQASVHFTGTFGYPGNETGGGVLEPAPIQSSAFPAVCAPRSLKQSITTHQHLSDTQQLFSKQNHFDRHSSFNLTPGALDDSQVFASETAVHRFHITVHSARFRTNLYTRQIYDLCVCTWNFILYKLGPSFVHWECHSGPAACTWRQYHGLNRMRHADSNIVMKTIVKNKRSRTLASICHSFTTLSAGSSKTPESFLDMLLRLRWANSTLW